MCGKHECLPKSVSLAPLSCLTAVFVGVGVGRGVAAFSSVEMRRCCSEHRCCLCLSSCSTLAKPSALPTCFALAHVPSCCFELALPACFFFFFALPCRDDELSFALLVAATRKKMNNSRALLLLLLLLLLTISVLMVFVCVKRKKTKHYLQVICCTRLDSDEAVFVFLFLFFFFLTDLGRFAVFTSRKTGALFCFFVFVSFR